MGAADPRYASFVLRVWQRELAPRVDVEHVQTGDRTKADSLAAAVAWIERVTSNAAPPEDA